jgi:outer membrane protein assembly factor BamE (lipoprotein component of BamABCDE complex)
VGSTGQIAGQIAGRIADGRRASWRTALGAGLLALTLAGCAEVPRTHGYVPTEAELDAIEVNLDTRDTVRSIIGDPAVTGMLDDRGWFYVKSQFRTYGWREPEETRRDVVAVLFDERGLVENIERFGIEEGEVIALSRRVTETDASSIGFLQQLLGNIGNFNPAGFLGEGT